MFCWLIEAREVECETWKETTLKSTDQESRGVHLSSVLHEPGSDEDTRPSEDKAGNHPTRVETFEDEGARHFECDISDVE